jgi:hypothetical protein
MSNEHRLLQSREVYRNMTAGPGAYDRTHLR